MSLEIKVVPDEKQYMFILQLLGKEDLCFWEYFPLDAPSNNEKEQPDCIWEAFEDSFKQTTTFMSYREQNLYNLLQQENESIVDLLTRLSALLEKCNYNQCCMNTCKVHLFIHRVKYIPIRTWAREQQRKLSIWQAT